MHRIDCVWHLRLAVTRPAVEPEHADGVSAAALFKQISPDRRREPVDRLFAKFANATAHAAGHPIAFLICVAFVVAWAATGPLFDFSETWQLVINTGTTIITFLMVFLIQNTQNRDGAAIQTKLDELIHATDADDAFMGIEKMTDAELAELHDQLAASAERTQSALKRTKQEKEVRKGRRGKGR
jgi:low affinity Fe/Cu permease